MLAADPSSNEICGPMVGTVIGAVLNPVAALLPTRLNTFEDQTFHP